MCALNQYIDDIKPWEVAKKRQKDTVAFAAALQGWWGVRLGTPLRAAALVAGTLCFVPHTPLRIAGILASLGLGCAARRGGRVFRQRKRGA